MAVLEASHYDAGLQQFVRALEAPLRERISALESRHQGTLSACAPPGSCAIDAIIGLMWLARYVMQRSTPSLAPRAQTGD